MSVRELSPLFSWGFTLRRSKWLVPLFNNNVFNFGNSAVSGPYGWNSAPISRPKTTNIARTETVTAPSSSISPSIRKEVNDVEVARQNCGMAEAPTKEQTKQNYKDRTDGEIIDLLQSGELQHHKLEAVVLDPARAVKLRRMFLASDINPNKDTFAGLPYENYDYKHVLGQCCENVVGYVPIPVGIVGPFLVDGREHHVPMATTEGCLIASTQRGAKALSLAGGVTTVILSDGMTRGPVVQMPSAKRSGELKQWLANEENFKKIEQVFNSTSRFARLKELKVGVAGRKVFIRFKCQTGDAMGMNMISKAVTAAMDYLQQNTPDMRIISVSGNFCTDKKPSSINWTEGRGKSVVCDATIPKALVETVLKSSVDALVDLNVTKNLIGSAMAGSIGGFNAHASNIVTAVFLATGQDCAQNVESSTCMTLMEKTASGDLYISCTMPSIEVGTVGGGTHLPAQNSCLQILGVNGPHPSQPGQNAQSLARMVCATVMAGELSLMSALAEGHLVESHMKLNRKK